jgi:hypothetical protein
LGRIKPARIAITASTPIISIKVKPPDVCRPFFGKEWFFTGSESESNPLLYHLISGETLIISAGQLMVSYTKIATVATILTKFGGL